MIEMTKDNLSTIIDFITECQRVVEESEYHRLISEFASSDTNMSFTAI